MSITTVNTTEAAGPTGTASSADPGSRSTDPLPPRPHARGRGRLSAAPPLPDATCLEVWGRSVLSSRDGYDEDGIETHILRGTD